MTIPLARFALPGVASMNPYQPGKPVEELQRELGLSDVIKLASNENPMGAGQKARTVLDTFADKLGRYPDGSGHRLKHALSERLGVDTSQITLGNGSDEIIEMLPRIFLGEGKSAVYSQYGFAVYPLAVQVVGGQGLEAPAFPPDHAQPLGHDPRAMLAAIQDNTRIIYIANPNNPTGTCWDSEGVREFLSQVPEDIIVVLDEAYYEYFDPDLRGDSIKLLDRYSNLMITRTFSKIHGLAGLRIGYSLTHPELADLLNRARSPFNNNAVALAAAEAALDDEAHVRQSIDLNNTGKNYLYTELTSLELDYIPSQANFVSINLRRDGRTIYEKLLHEGVIVRPMASYEMPEYIRVTIGSHDENERFINALKRVLS